MRVSPHEEAREVSCERAVEKRRRRDFFLRDLRAAQDLSGRVRPRGCRDRPERCSGLPTPGRRSRPWRPRSGQWLRPVPGSAG
ncbi:MAG: hypothetical protein DI601_11260 [Azospirillum brasilense]|nr:MAG: hypothetical protein DI601_11260 [Azospirillum brasilense]